jgi:hypothetical protein
MTNQITLTEKSLSLFLSLARDAKNWNGEPLLDVSKEERGNLTQLKREGLLSTFRDEGCDWVIFSQAGSEFAAQHGIKL